MYLCNHIGLEHPLSHRKTVSVHLGMQGTSDCCLSLLLLFYHFRTTENIYKAIIDR